MTDSHTPSSGPAEQTATRLSVSFFGGQMTWLQARAEMLNCSVGEVVRRCVQQAADLPAPAPTPSKAPEEPALPAAPESLPLWMARHHSVEAVAIHMGLPLATVRGWLEADPELQQACAEASWGFVLRMEARYLAIGLGEQGGQRQALEGFLQAHHPNYGRVKAELVRRELRPWCARVLAALREAVGESTDAGRAVLRSFSDRLTGLSSDAVRDFT